MSADIDFSKILFRASSMGDIMSNARGGVLTDPQAKYLAELLEKAKTKQLSAKQQDDFATLIKKRDEPAPLGDTCIKRLIKVYNKARYFRETQITSKYFEKGIAVEQDNITAYCLYSGKYFRKNDIRIENRYLSGEPDAFDGPDDDIMNAEEIVDFKSPWDLDTFTNAKLLKYMDPDYEWQGHSYLALVPSAKRFRLVYGLVNSTAKIINDEKRKKSWALGVASTESTDPEYIAACQQIERNHIFDMPLFLEQNPGFIFHNEGWPDAWNIPLEERIHELVMERNQSKINEMYKKIDRGRKWMEENL
jgi:hypothetical protein